MYFKIRLLIAMSIWPAVMLIAQLPYQNPDLTSEARAKDCATIWPASCILLDRRAFS